MPRFFAATPVPGRPDRMRVDSGSIWEEICGFSPRTEGRRSHPRQRHHRNPFDRRAGLPQDPAGQAVYILDKIAASLAALGASMADVVRTRVYLQDADDWDGVSRVHGRYLAEARPANTLFEIGRLVGPYRVEIEAEAVLDRR